MQERDLEESSKVLKDLGLVTRCEDPSIGETYPLLGRITNIISSQPKSMVLEVNEEVIIYLALQGSAEQETVEQRVFEHGIFIGEVVENDPQIILRCDTAIFGKSEAANT